MIFQDPWYALLLIPLAVAIFFYRRLQKQPGITFSSCGLIPEVRKSARLFWTENIYVLRLLAGILCVVALMRPQAPLEESLMHTEGIDIVLAVDLSGSMRAEDFTLKGKRANRLAAAKDVISEFVHARGNDRIGVIAFAQRAYTVCPLTLDYAWLLENIERLEIGMIEDGTAIGSGLSSALNRLQDSQAKSTIVILLTDGRNNAGKVSPQRAAEAAAALGVKVYTVGAGTHGTAPYPVQDFFGNTVYRSLPVDIDEETLQMIASQSGGTYFRATDTKSLKNIYKEIDAMERTTIEEQGYLEFQELFPFFLIPALLLVLCEIILKNTLLRQLP
jgi:Ca-activated chloride channel homolog